MQYDLSLPEDLRKFNERVSQFISDCISVDLKKVHRKRTLSQNSFLHILITLYGIEFGYTIEESKTHLKRTCPFMRYEKKGEWFLKRTSEMDVTELSDFIEWIYNYSAINGLVLPSSDSYFDSMAYYNNLIEDNKEYL